MIRILKNVFFLPYHSFQRQNPERKAELDNASGLTTRVSSIIKLRLTSVDVTTLMMLTVGLKVVLSYNSAIRVKMTKSTRNQSGPNGLLVQECDKIL